MRRTLSNAVEHARGWVATKTGLVDIFGTAKPVGGSGLYFKSCRRQAIRLLCSGVKCLSMKFNQKQTIEQRSISLSSGNEHISGNESFL